MSLSWFESLERRQLLHGGTFDVHVNFQPAASAVPSGYLADSGLVYGDRGNGFTYGWDAANTTSTRDRNVLADQRYDTFEYTGGPEFLTRTRELAADSSELSFQLERWIDPANFGWFSGDHHVHAAGCSHGSGQREADFTIASMPVQSPRLPACRTTRAAAGRPKRLCQ